MGWLASLKPTVPAQSSINPIKLVLYNSPKLPLKDLPIIFYSMLLRFVGFITTASERLDFKLFSI